MSSGAIYSLLLPSEKTGMQQWTDTMTREERILTTRPPSARFALAAGQDERQEEKA